MAERDYQALHISRIIEEVSSKRKVLAQLPTGGGKTYEFTLIVERYIRNTGKSVLILVHRQELMNQAAKTIKSLLDIDAYIIDSKTKRLKYSRVYIGMVDSLVRRLNFFDNVGMVIIDECHIANFNKCHNIFLEELIIGFSATPISSSKREPLNKYYSSIVSGPQINELISLGYLSQNITRVPKNLVDSTKFSVDKLKGDYNEKQMATEYKAPKHITNVVQNYYKFCKGEKTIVFNVNIEHSKEVCDFFVLCGINCRHLDSNSENREEILEWYRVTEDAVLCNVMIATVGFDEPTIRHVILNFSTMSMVKYIQCAGRGGRIIDDEFIERFQSRYNYQLSKKDSFNIIDMGGNYLRFGDWNNDRNWDYIFNNPEKVYDGIAPVKTCPQCDGLVHASRMTCNLTNELGELCLYEFERKLTPEEQEYQEMVVVTQAISIEDKIDKNQKKYDYYTFFELAEDVIDTMYKSHTTIDDSTKIKYFKIYYKLCCDWWVKYMAKKDGNIDNIENSTYHINRAKNNFDNLVLSKAKGKTITIGENNSSEVYNYTR